MSSTAASSSYRIVRESETTVYYPKSKRKVVLNHRGEIISDTRDDKEKGKKEEGMDY